MLVCFVCLPHDTVGLSVVCDFGIPGHTCLLFVVLSDLKETRNAFDCITIGSRSKNNYFW